MSMEIRKFLAALQTKASAQQAPLCDDADTVLVLLCNTITTSKQQLNLKNNNN